MGEVLKGQQIYDKYSKAQDFKTLILNCQKNMKVCKKNSFQFFILNNKIGNICNFT